MNKIERLIRELCPEGVPHFGLGEVAEIIKGTQVNKETMSDAYPYPVYNGGISPSGRHTEFNFPSETITVSQGGASAGFVNFVREPLWVGAHCYAVRPSKTVLNRWLFFALKNSQGKLQDKKVGAGIPALDRKTLLELNIPVPPLRIQQEIVSILDKFTELEAELEAELDARSNQYERYRDALFDFRADNTAHPLKSFLGGSTFEGVEWVAIGNLGELFPGLSGKSKEDFSNGNRPFVSYLDIGNNASLPREIVSKVAVGLGERQNEIKLGDILFTGSSEDKVGVGLTSEVEYEPDEPTYLNSFCFGLRPEPGRFAKGFLKHLFRSSGIRQKVIACGNGVTRINISKKLLLKVEVPQPPLSLQEAIVSILDKLDAIVTGTQASLPAEIQARRKQYEYYRNKLLTFKELDTK